MDTVEVVMAASSGCVVGIGGTWLVMWARTSALTERLAGKEAQLADLRRTLDARDARVDALLKLQEGAQGDADARQKAIGELVKPLSESLARVEGQVQAIEKERISSFAALNLHIETLAVSQRQLQGETAKLARALRSPQVRGRWGEVQLRRVVELAGMLEYCDFEQQPTAHGDQGRQRPDLIVRLPGGRNVVIDAKVPMEAYLGAVEAQDDPARQAQLKEHARQVRSHLQQLGSKTYWEQFQPTPEFVVLFLPGEALFSAALEQDPALIEFGVDQKVLVATPTTLIALLKAVAHGWREEQIADNARAISALGKQMYDRIKVLADHLEDVRKGLSRAVDSFNKAVGSLDARILPTARRFRELGAATGDDIADVEVIERAPRGLEAVRDPDG